MTWRIMTLADLAAPFKGSITDGPFGSNLARQHYRDSGPRVVRLQNIGDGEFIDNAAHIATEHFELLRKHEVQAGDLLVASLSEKLPRACIAPSFLGPAIVKADCIRVRLRDGVDPRWVNYAMQRPSVRRWAERHRHGMGRPRLGLTGIREIPVPVPSLEEQRRIVEILEDHLSQLDAASKDLARARARLDSLIEAALRSHVKPDTKTRPLADVLEMPLANGRSVPSRDEGFPVLRLTALKEDGVDLTERKDGAWERADAMRFLVRRGDFLIARGNGSLRLVGKGSLVRSEPDEVAFPDTVIRARPRPVDLSPEFLDLIWNARATRDQIERVARTSAGIYKVNQAQLGAIQLPVPASSEQRSVIAAMDRLRDHRQGTLEAIDIAEQRSRGLRRAVLAAAFDGKLTGRHTDEEIIEESAGT